MWEAALSNFSPMDVKYALNRLLESGATFPPSAPEFRAMCENKTDDTWEHQGQAYKPFQKDMKHLEHKPKSKAEKAEFTKRWREGLGL